MRRFCLHNRLNVLWTLTYESSEWSVDRVKADLARFFRALRAYRGSAFPYLWVIEEHPNGHGLHVHIAMRGFIRKGDLQALWGLGIVQYSKRSRQAREALSGKALAAYLAKELAGYVAKGSATERLDGSHFYDVAQGFQPEHEGEDVQTAGDGSVIGHAAMRWFGGEVPHRVWCSDELGDEWVGPRVLCLYWYGRSP